MELTTILSGLATLGVGVNLVVNLRAQRDMAQLENKILQAINGKYISRNEHVVIETGHSDTHGRLGKQIEDLEERASKTRESHFHLRDEFIECRAAHNAGAPK